MDKMREEFELAWAESRTSEDGTIGNRPLRSLINNDHYRGDAVNFAWMWWKRSRAALRVELPEAETSFDGDSIFTTSDVCESLDNAGVKYK